MKSCIYFGSVRHARWSVVEHAFSYRHAFLYLDLDELPHLFDGRWLWSVERPNVASVRRSDYLGDASRPLADAVRERVRTAIGRDVRGSVRLLTQPRFLGYVFNPVSFYFCFDGRDERLAAVVAEITNTPWNERHAYVLSAYGDGAHARFPKRFHVSPFQPMELEYEWSISVPGDELRVGMRNLEHGRPVFAADMRLERRELEGRSLARFLTALPGLSLRTSAAIYWQALRLRIAGAPFHAHPGRANAAEARAR